MSNKEQTMVLSPATPASEIMVAGKGITAGKYLAFQMADEEYAIEILKVQEIIGVTHITHVPKLPKYVRGIINLRGSVIPVVDLRLKFDMEFNEYNERTCIIVVQIDTAVEHTIMGIIVDQVSEVIDFTVTQLEGTPDFGAGMHNDYILGMGKLENRVIVLLNIEKVLSTLEMELL